MNAIDISNLNKHFGKLHAVNDMALSVAAGECVALAGHNGAGKSTLMKMMLGLLRPDSGELRIFGHAPESREARMRGGYLPETVSLYPALTGRETLAFYARLKKQPLAGNKALLEKVGIEKAADRRVGTYSKGMRQRLALAQALLGNPQILFLDEPTTGLDPASRQQFYDILRELREQGTGIILSSHALAELVGQVDRIVIMKNGVKTADGTLQSLREDAGLPTRIVAWFDGAPELPAQWRKESDGSVMTVCTEAEKAVRLGELYRNHAPRNIDILPPTLDELYAHFLSREDR